MKIWTFRVASVIAAVGVALLASEIALRLLLPEPRVTGRVYEFSSTLHHRLVPGGSMRHVSAEFDYLWVNNSLGMRDRERSAHKADGTFRILFLGDSMIQGHGVPLEATVPFLLESALSRSGPSRPVEVLNAGVFGYGPLLEDLFLEQRIDVLSPDVVLLGFSLANDVGDDQFYQTKARFGPAEGQATFADREWPWSKIVEALDRQEPQAGSAELGFAPALESFGTRSRVARLLVNAVTAPSRKRAYLERRRREFELVRDRRDDIAYNLAFVNYADTDPGMRARYWSETRRWVGRIVDACRSRGIRIAVVVIPPAERLIGETSFDEPYRVLDRWGEDLAVPVIQLLPGFLERARDPGSPRLYYEFDRHWTAEGTALAARILERELRRLGLTTKS